MSYSEIKAYYDLQQHVPEPWEADLIRYMDVTTMNVYAEKAKQEQSKSSKK